MKNLFLGAICSFLFLSINAQNENKDPGKYELGVNYNFTEMPGISMAFNRYFSEKKILHIPFSLGGGFNQNNFIGHASLGVWLENRYKIFNQDWLFGSLGPEIQHTFSSLPFDSNGRISDKNIQTYTLGIGYRNGYGIKINKHLNLTGSLGVQAGIKYSSEPNHGPKFRFFLPMKMGFNYRF